MSIKKRKQINKEYRKKIISYIWILSISTFTIALLLLNTIRTNYLPNTKLDNNENIEKAKSIVTSLNIGSKLNLKFIEIDNNGRYVFSSDKNTKFIVNLDSETYSIITKDYFRGVDE